MSAENTPNPTEKRFDPFVDYDFTHEATAPNQSQQNKIIHYFETADLNVLGRDDVVVSDDQRKLFLQQLLDDQISEQQMKDLLINIRPPVADEPDPSNPTMLFNQVALDRQQKGIVAHFTRGDLNARSEINAADLGAFLQRFPEPISLEARTGSFLDMIERLNSAQKRMEYSKSLQELEKTVYGKRQEYWDQIKILALMAQTVETGDYREIGEEESNKLLRWTEFHGDPYEGERLTHEILAREGLAPKFGLEVGGLKMAFSDQYQLEGDRTAVVGYIQTEDKKVVARTYYLSHSQGLWRYLPSYAAGWFDKGHGEDSLNLPNEAQALLGSLSGGEIKEIEDPQLIFYGTARGPERGGITYQQETGRDPEHLAGNFYTEQSKNLIIPPEQVVFSNQAQAPDFTTIVASWESESGLYGHLTSEVYLSKDGLHRYIFNRDSKGRAWIATVENNSNLTSTGVGEKWTDGGDLVMPLYEYYEQSGGYGTYEPEAGHYVQMWDDYLSKVPIIQEYLRSKESA